MAARRSFLTPSELLWLATEQHHAAAAHQAELERLVRLLSRGRYLTVAQIAERTGCSKVSAHRRIRALKKRLKLQMKKVREGAAGPLSIGYAIKI